MVGGGASKEPAAVIAGRAAEIQGYRHLLTFASGPRACLGRNFALVEFKVSGLVRLSIFSSLTFSLPLLYADLGCTFCAGSPFFV